jgi:acyl-CoA-binding protein
MKVAENLAVHLEENARSELDNEAACLLRRLGRIYDVAYEMVHAKTHEHSKSAYVEMIDLIKGKQGV